MSIVCVLILWEIFGRFNEDISLLTKAIRNGDGKALFARFVRPRHPPGHRGSRPRFARTRLRPPAPDLPHAPLPQPYAADED